MVGTIVPRARRADLHRATKARRRTQRIMGPKPLAMILQTSQVGRDLPGNGLPARMGINVLDQHDFRWNGTETISGRWLARSGQQEQLGHPLFKAVQRPVQRQDDRDQKQRPCRRAEGRWKDHASIGHRRDLHQAEHEQQAMGCASRCIRGKPTASRPKCRGHAGTSALNAQRPSSVRAVKAMDTAQRLCLVPAPTGHTQWHRIAHSQRVRNAGDTVNCQRAVGPLPATSDTIWTEQAMQSFADSPHEGQ